MRLIKVKQALKALALPAMLISGMCAGMSSAYAGTGAEATIHSSAKLSYNGGSAFAGATVMVKLVAAPVTIKVDTSSATIDAGQNVQFTYTFESNANGKDNYTLATDSIDNSGVDTPTISFAEGTSVELGASITSAPMDTTNVLKIPAGTMDMFNDNDIVRLSDGSGSYPGTYRVVSRTNGTVATTNATGDTLPETPALITLVTVTGSDLTNVPAGVQIGEVKDVVVTITAGTVNGGAVDPEHVINISITSDTDSSAKATTTDGDNNEIIISVDVPSTLQFIKEVKESDAPDSSYVVYLESEPGKDLTYRLTVTNESQAVVTGAIVEDVIPNFTTFIDGTITLNGEAYDGTAPWSDAGMTILSTSATNQGDILVGESAVVTYQVTIN